VTDAPPVDWLLKLPKDEFRGALQRVKPRILRLLLQTIKEIRQRIVGDAWFWEGCIHYQMPRFRSFLEYMARLRDRARLSAALLARVYRNLYFRIEQYYVWLKNRKPVFFLFAPSSPATGDWMPPPPPIVHRIDTETRINELVAQIRLDDNWDLFSGMSLREIYERIQVHGWALVPWENWFAGGDGAYMVEVPRPLPLGESHGGTLRITEMSTMNTIPRRENTVRFYTGQHDRVAGQRDIADIAVHFGSYRGTVEVRDTPLLWIHDRHGAVADPGRSLLDITHYVSVPARPVTALTPFMIGPGPGARKQLWTRKLFTPKPGEASRRHYSAHGGPSAMRGDLVLDDSPENPRLDVSCTVDVDYIAAVYRDFAMLAREDGVASEFTRWFSAQHLRYWLIGADQAPIVDPVPAAYRKALDLARPPDFTTTHAARFWREHRRMHDCILMFLDFEARVAGPGAPVDPHVAYESGYLYDLSAIGIEHPELRLLEILLMRDAPLDPATGEPYDTDALPIPPADMYLTHCCDDAGEPRAGTPDDPSPVCGFYHCPRPEEQPRYCCKRCKRPYCSRQCQEKDWVRHRSGCL
jgi:hypothetical protein